MNKSLLSLLQEEHQLLQDLEYSKGKAIDKRDWLNKAEQEGLEHTSGYQMDLGELAIYEMEWTQTEARLLEIRKEIKEYISFLETL